MGSIFQRHLITSEIRFFSSTTTFSPANRYLLSSPDQQQEQKCSANAHFYSTRNRSECLEIIFRLVTVAAVAAAAVTDLLWQSIRCSFRAPRKLS